MAKIVAILPVRNEDWVLGCSLRALLMWVDEVVVLDHSCTDDTGKIILEIAKETAPTPPLHYVFSADLCWTEMRHRQLLLSDARAVGATHIVTVDADEILTGDLLPTIRDRIAELQPGTMLRLPLLNLRGSLDRVHDTGLWGNRDANTSVAFRDEPDLYWKADADGYDHHCREPKGRTWRMPLPVNRNSGLMHLQFVNERRLKAKQYLYQLNERLRWPSRNPAAMVAMYQRTVREHLTATGTGAAVPASWWAPYAHLMPYLHVDREPWQIAECHRLIKANPGIEVGLDNFGLDL